MPSGAVISVILAVRRTGDPLRVCLESLVPQVEAAGGELIVVLAGEDGLGVLAGVAPGAVRVEADHDALVPQLWGIGIPQARSAWIALTSTDCRPAGDWVAAIARATGAEPPCAAVGGPVEPPVAGKPADWALYFARFHAFLPPGGGGSVSALPGENAAYRRVALERAWTRREEGFWEAFVNHRLVGSGESLCSRADVRVRMLGGNRLVACTAERYRHGHHFGSTRIHGGRVERWARTASTPLLPPFLALRIARRVVRSRPDLLPRFLVTLPWTLVILGTWSLGEARGYLDQRKRTRVPTNVTPSSG